ncbi:MAG: hypothetical protein HRT68_01035 [Flavobacteriaceae bacterium]|nr:hypothetical protein [Flavobacteriaceae bacterium]
MNVNKTNHNVKRVKKHEVNLQKNNRTHFQIGLIVMLLLCYFVVEAKFEIKEVEPPVTEELSEVYTAAIKKYKLEEPEVLKTEDPITESKKKQASEIKVVENENQMIDNLKQEFTVNADEGTSKNFDASDVLVFDDDPEVEKFTILSVQEKPIFPGCEDAEDKVMCMQSKIDRIIQRRFDTEEAADHGLSGKQAIMVTFKINKKGEVVDIKPMIRGRNAKKMSPRAKKALIDETRRVVGLFPEVVPGKVNGQPVDVLYSLPIKFIIE